MTNVHLNDLEDSEVTCEEAPLRYAGGATPQPPRASAKTSGWVRNQMPECPMYCGLWVCALCCRSGFDLRYLFCPYH